jgi:hypothetical protein
MNWTTSACGEERRESLKTKYGEKALLDLKSQRALYWLSIDQIIPPPLKFRCDLEAEHDLNWHDIDKTKLFNDSRMQAFLWRSTHGKLNARKDLMRFNYIQDQCCTQCESPIQSVKHVFLDCVRNRRLFANFEAHIQLTEKLLWPP